MNDTEPKTVTLLLTIDIDTAELLWRSLLGARAEVERQVERLEDEGIWGSVEAQARHAVLCEVARQFNNLSDAFRTAATEAAK
jgi:hypothetical protein